jgi:hypothetical protein
MNPEIARRAKEYAHKNHTTFTAVVEEAVTKLLDQPRRKKQKIVLPTAGDPKRRMTHEQYRQAVERMYEEEAEQILRGYK